MDDTTMDGIVAWIKETVENIGTGLEPNDDWIPILGLLGTDKPAIIGIPNLGDPAVKDTIAKKVIPGLIQQGKPNFAALVTMGWMKQYDPTTLEGAAEQARDEAKYERGNIADRPGKSECLCIHVVSKDGTERQLMAYVHRHPTLSPKLQWYLDSTGTKEKSAGRFPDALRAGMEAAWKKK
jgi:hypothetical protein